jgi:uncharacterized membrane protein YeaQ/YmgE (transglycosylase-associated protein family)
MHILWTIVIGLVAGIIAKLIMPGKDPGGFIITILLGIAGSLIATYCLFRSNRPPVPKETVHLFRFILATYSDSKNPLNRSVATLDEDYFSHFSV